jgi:hypothetical protein
MEATISARVSARKRFRKALPARGSADGSWRKGPNATFHLKKGRPGRRSFIHDIDTVRQSWFTSGKSFPSSKIEIEVTLAKRTEA